MQSDSIASESLALARDTLFFLRSSCIAVLIDGQRQSTRHACGPAMLRIGVSIWRVAIGVRMKGGRVPTARQAVGVLSLSTASPTRAARRSVVTTWRV